MSHNSLMKEVEFETFIYPAKDNQTGLVTSVARPNSCVPCVGRCERSVSMNYGGVGVEAGQNPRFAARVCI
jgi:hypothetical protein